MYFDSDKSKRRWHHGAPCDLVQLPNLDTPLIRQHPPPIHSPPFFAKNKTNIKRKSESHLRSQEKPLPIFFFFASFCISLPSPRLSNYLMDTKICTARFLWIIPTCNTTLVTACICTTTSQGKGNVTSAKLFRINLTLRSTSPLALHKYECRLSGGCK